MRDEISICGERYIEWVGDNKKEIKRFLDKRISKICFKPYLIFNGFKIKKGIWLCLNKYGGLDFLSKDSFIKKIGQF